MEGVGKEMEGGWRGFGNGGRGGAGGGCGCLPALLTL
jgi:hypothetical protein